MKVTKRNIDILLSKEVYNTKELTYLKALLEYCNDVYYNAEDNDVSPLTDIEFDTLFNRYNSQVKKSNKVTTLTKPTKGKKMVNVEHEYPELVGTLDKITNKEELKEWLIKKFSDAGIGSKEEIELCVSNKEDGNSICGTFNLDGTAESFLTRGKEGQGADMTELFNHIKLKLPVKNNANKFGVKFEAVMLDEDFEKYNEEYQKINNKSLSNNRSAVAGILGSDEGYKFIKYVSLVPLTVKVLNKEVDKSTQIKIFESFMKQSKFIKPFNYKLFKGTKAKLYKDIVSYYEKMTKERETLNKPIDGLVIEFTDLKIRKKLGREHDRNKFDVAFKFPPMTKKSKVKSIKFYYGKTGTITPVVHFEDVIFNGAVCNHVSIANYKRFKELNLSVGDSVIIDYRNDVLAYLSLDKTAAQKNNPIPFIKNCPICDSKLKINDNETFVYCDNSKCKGRVVGKLENYLIKIGLKGIKTSTLEKLVEGGLIETIPDLYRLKVKDIMQIEGFLEKSASNIVSIINSKQELYSYELLGSLQINQFSRRSAKVIMKKFTLEELLELHKDRINFLLKISDIEGFKTLTASYIYDGITDNMDIIKFLMKKLTIKETKTTENKVNGQTYKFVFTGFRDKVLQEELENEGHTVTSSVSKNTNYLVVKDKTATSTKITKAKELGVTIIDIDDAKNRRF